MNNQQNEVRNDYTNPLDNFGFLDVHTWSDYPEVNLAVDSIFKEVQPHIKFHLSKDKMVKYKRHLKIIILDLYVKHLQQPDRWVGYSRNKNNFGRNQRLKKIHISGKYLVELIDILGFLGYIEDVKGFYDRESGIRKCSRMRATEALLDLIFSHGIKPKMITAQHEEIILKDDNKKIIEYKETRRVLRMKKNVRRINALIETAEITLPLTLAEKKEVVNKCGHLPDTYKNNKYRRIFNNGSWSKGGRFFDHWIQMIPKIYRKKLLIDGEPVTELDYSGFHINLLYDLIGQPRPYGDVYQIAISDYMDKRSAMKVLLQTILNAKSEETAINAAMEKTRKNGFLFTKDEIQEMAGLFTEKHSPLRKFFYSGIGIKLQNIESNIAEDILIRLADKNIVCLCIHDSFIVKRSFRRKLYDAMKNAYSAQLNKTPVIDIKY